VCPVQGKPIQKGWIIFVATDLEEFNLEALVRLLEEGQQYPPNNLIKTHPQLLTWAFGFEKIKEYVQ